MSKADVVIRITGIARSSIRNRSNLVVEKFQREHLDYCSNADPPTFPDGLDTEVFSFAALKAARNDATKPAEREHVTPYIKHCGKFRIASVQNSEDYSTERWTVDEPEDFQVVTEILVILHPDEFFLA
jgi:glutamate-1-semialdehyde 2,1-aminomutase